MASGTDGRVVGLAEDFRSLQPQANRLRYRESVDRSPRRGISPNTAMVDLIDEKAPPAPSFNPAYGVHFR